MPKNTFLMAVLCMAVINTSAQQKWDLKSIVECAMANNIGVKLSDVQAKIAAVNYKQNKLSQYPTLGFSGSAALNNGSNQDPTTFSRITQSYISTGLQLQSSADIFNFYSKRNTIQAYKWEEAASKANVDKIKNDIALTAANAYLQILLNKVQENIAAVQIQQTQAQLTNTRKQVDAGALPELNASQLEAQLALDSLNYITAKGNTELSVLTLKSYLNIDAAAPFEVDTPPVELIPVEPIADLQPDVVYKLALANQPLQHYDDYKLKAAEKFAAAARAAMYPTISAFGSLGSSYIAASTPGYIATPNGFIPNGSKITVGGQDYLVQVPSFIYTKSGKIKSDPFGTQLSDNFRQSIGLNISVPIFNGGSLRANYETGKLNISTYKLQKEQDDQKLKQDIYQAYNAAMIALEKFNTSKKSVEINEKNLNFANKRAEVGMLGTFDLITTQNNLLRSKLEYASNQFDYVFKIKVLEFYKGLGLKL